MQWSGGAPYVHTYMEISKTVKPYRIGMAESADAVCKCKNPKNHIECENVEPNYVYSKLWLQYVKSDPIGTRGGNGALHY